MPDDIDRVLREHVRYTGDGLPGEPTGAPLPAGDPMSGAHSANKADLRELLHWLIPQWPGGDGILEFSLTVNIPSDFATMQEALDFYSRYRAKHGCKIAINIETGHQPTHGLLVQDGDYSNFWITSDDAEVTLPVGFVGANSFDGPDINTANSFILCQNALGPVLDILLDADGNADSGYTLFAKSTGWVNRLANENELTHQPPLPRKCGIKNCSKYNFRARDGSILYAEASIASGAGRSGFYANRCSIIHCVQSDVTNCVAHGIVGDRGSIIVADMSDCSGCEVGFFAIYSTIISASDAVANDCGIGFFASMASSIVAQGGTANNAVAIGEATDYHGRGFVSIRGSRINAYNSTAENAVHDGYFAEDGATITAVGASANGAGSNGFTARGGSVVAAQSATAVGAVGNGFEAANGGIIDARAATATGCGMNAVFATSTGTVNAEIAVLTGAASHAVYATKGAKINAFGAVLSGAGGAEVRVDHGSFITVSSATTRSAAPGVPNIGDTNVAAFNTLYGGGVIFNA